MISTKEFLRVELENGIGFHNPAFVNLARVTANQLADLEVKTILDYGAGTGVYSKAYMDAGYDVVAFELFKEHRDYIKAKAPEIKLIKKPKTTDLLSFIETAEHMTDEELDTLLTSIEPKYILFSSTSERIPDFDEDWGHINIKEQIEWDAFFAEYGYTKLRGTNKPTAWAKIYIKK